MHQFEVHAYFESNLWSGRKQILSKGVCGVAKDADAYFGRCKETQEEEQRGRQGDQFSAGEFAAFKRSTETPLRF
ncbi:hypothetical protein HHUSO_G36888 [Huso huso]|uniref:Uncharacterized protein n=1 Tax=Huso huso TaxID=61971 RepID=A0ABR0Y092_HUSHU